MREGAEFPPLVVFDNGDNLFIADGFLRDAASGRAGTHNSSPSRRTAATARPSRAPTGNSPSKGSSPTPNGRAGVTAS